MRVASDRFYRFYRVVMDSLAHSGVNRIVGPRGRALSDRLETFVRVRLAPKAPSVGHVAGYVVRYPDGGFFGEGLMNEDIEPRTTKLFQRLLTHSTTFVDVGAHVGYYSLLAASIVNDDGHVYAFEPDPENMSFLKRNIAENQLDLVVTAVETAVGDWVGTANPLIGRRDRMSSSLFQNDGVSSSTVPCSVTTLDTYFSQLRWPSVDLMKIDAEGAETSILRGMQTLSTRNPNLKVIIEFHLNNVLASGNQPCQFFGALRENGFIRFSVISDNLQEIHEETDIEEMVKISGQPYVNILCEKQ